MHIPGYFSLRYLKNNTSKSDWSSHHQDKTFGQYHDLFFSSRPKIDCNFDIEKLRQTIMKHESIFQHQLHELHRLYYVQRDMMNETRASRDLQEHSSALLCFPPDNGKNGRHTGCNSSTQSGLRFKNGELFESKCKKLQRRLFDLELLADKYTDEDNDDVPEVSVNIRYNSEVNQTREGSSLLSSMRKSVMIDLNEHVVDNKFVERSHDGTQGVDLTNLQMETERRCRGSLYIENGHEENRESSFSGISRHCNLETPYRSPQEEHEKLYPNRIEACTKKKIFGVEVSEFNSSSNKSLKILGYPILQKHCETLHYLPASCSSSKSSSLVTVLLDGAKSTKVELISTDPTHDPMLPKPREKQSVNGFSDSKLFIDLNLCVQEGSEEEEAQVTPSSPRNNCRRLEIDLEVPASMEPETSGRESLESIPKDESLDRPQAFKEDNKELINFAVEALVSISLHNMHDLQVNAMCQKPEASWINPLCWFVDVISSREIRLASMGVDTACCEDIIPDGMDYFEYRTLKLTETKVEEHNNNNHWDIGNLKIQNMTRRLSQRRPGRKGRRQKDFQRVILPSITCLSRNEVIDDLQTIEGLITEAGGKWQSGLTHNSMGKSGSGIGRKRSCGGSCGVSGSDPTTDAAAPPPHLLPTCGCKESRIEERSLAGWGKRTRRPRPLKQRCMINNDNTLLITSK